jgi:hypothetical protein
MSTNNVRNARAQVSRFHCLSVADLTLVAAAVVVVVSLNTRTRHGRSLTANVVRVSARMRHHTHAHLLGDSMRATSIVLVRLMCESSSSGTASAPAHVYSSNEPRNRSGQMFN